MEIGNNTSLNATGVFITSAGKGIEEGSRADLISNESKGKKPPVREIFPGKSTGSTEYSDAAKEMLPPPRNMGEFKDKKGLEEITDLQIGPDIRYALKSTNADYLNRLKWGTLTVAEFREVKYRLAELEARNATSNNMLKGKIIDEKYSPEASLKGERDRNKRTYTDLDLGGTQIDLRV